MEANMGTWSPLHGKLVSVLVEIGLFWIIWCSEGPFSKVWKYPNGDRYGAALHHIHHTCIFMDVYAWYVQIYVYICAWLMHSAHVHHLHRIHSTRTRHIHITHIHLAILFTPAAFCKTVHNCFLRFTRCTRFTCTFLTRTQALIVPAACCKIVHTCFSGFTLCTLYSLYSLY